MKAGRQEFSVPPGSEFLPASYENFTFCHAFEQQRRPAKFRVLYPSKLPLYIQTCIRAVFLLITSRRSANEDK